MSWLDALDIPFADDLWWGLLAIVALVLLVFFVIPALIFVVELLLFLLLLAVAGLLRVVLRRPWVVEAERTETGVARMRWAVVGWRRSGLVVDEVVEALSLGQSHIEPEGAHVIESGPPPDQES